MADQLGSMPGRYSNRPPRDPYSQYDDPTDPSTDPFAPLNVTGSTNPYDFTGTNKWGAFLAPVTDLSDPFFRDDPKNAMVQAINRAGGTGQLNDPFYRAMTSIVAPGMEGVFNLLNQGNGIEGATGWLDNYLGALTDHKVDGYGAGSPLFSYGEIGNVMNQLLGGAPGEVGEFFATADPSQQVQQILDMVKAMGYTGMSSMGMSAFQNALMQKFSDFSSMNSVDPTNAGSFLNFLKNSGMIDQFFGGAGNAVGNAAGAVGNAAHNLWNGVF